MKFVFFLINFLSISICLAEFTPEEIIILNNSNNPDSLRIAKYYAKLRNISSDQIVDLEVPDSFNIDRKTFNENIVAPLKAKIRNRKLLQKAKIIVTIYGLPLKIDEVHVPENHQEIQEYLLNKTDVLRKKLTDELTELNLLKAKLNSSDQQIEISSTIDFLLIQQELERLYKIILHKDPSSQEMEKLKKISTSLFGMILFSQNAKEETMNKLNLIKSIYSKIEIDRSSAKKVKIKDIETLLEKNKQLKGIIGAIIESKIIDDRVLAKESSASVDSELTMLWSLPSGSPISGRIPNPLFIDNKISVKQKFPMFLVSRLDGSTPEIVEKNISQSILTEANGYVKGNFLIDSRGLPFEQRDELGDWDRKLVSLARKNFGNKIEIEFDGSPDLKGKFGDISLYVGWYQLRNYQDNYTFNNGAIGYHIASEEALNIRDKTEKGWCKNLLDRGVVATVGAIEEPYLDSFPDPLYFFPLLASGKYNLIESYYLSTKYLSWRLVLFGDPLYNPFKNSDEQQKNIELDFKSPLSLSDRIISPGSIF